MAETNDSEGAVAMHNWKDEETVLVQVSEHERITVAPGKV